MYFLLLIDDFSRKCWVYFLKNKGEAFEHFQKFHALVERETRKKLKSQRIDRGGEFTSQNFREYCVEFWIRREFSGPYTPQQMVW